MLVLLYATDEIRAPLSGGRIVLVSKSSLDADVLEALHPGERVIAITQEAPGGEWCKVVEINETNVVLVPERRELSP